MTITIRASQSARARGVQLRWTPSHNFVMVNLPGVVVDRMVLKILAKLMFPVKKIFDRRLAIRNV